MLKWAKTLVAILLLPLCIGAVKALWLVLQASGHVTTIWVAFLSGVACWLVIYMLLPKPMWVYVFGHELTHGVTQFTANLEYEFQSGALNESMSDVFGSMIKQYFYPDGKQLATDADWLIGEGIFLPSITGAEALRSMKAPGTAYNNPKGAFS